MNVETQDLITRLQDHDPRVRSLACIGLGERKCVEATEALADILWDGDEWVQTQAANALAEIGTTQAIEYLVQACYERNSVAIVAVRALLIKLGIPGTEPCLTYALARDGTPRMAAEFIYCGNPTLEEAGNKYFDRFEDISYRDEWVNEPQYPRWGECRVSF